MDSSLKKKKKSYPFNFYGFKFYAKIYFKCFEKEIFYVFALKRKDFIYLFFDK